MPIKDTNAQVYTTLPVDLVKKIDSDAEKNSRSRSKEIMHILSQHYKKRSE